MSTRARNFKSVLGQRFGRLVVVAENEFGKGRRVSCVCDCGTRKNILLGGLRSGNTVSCGCHRKQRLTTHGNFGTPEYKAWVDMIDRCSNPNNKAFHHYGGRGIAVCESWLKSFDTFLADMGNRPEGHSLDRIDNDLGYEPSNCRWATRTQQLSNQRRNRLLTMNGETLTVSGWARRNGIYPEAALARIASGWEAERAVSTPVRKQKASL